MYCNCYITFIIDNSDAKTIHMRLEHALVVVARGEFQLLLDLMLVHEKDVQTEDSEGPQNIAQ